MRFISVLLLASLSAVAIAADAPPPNLQPLPAPPVLDSNAVDSDLEPQISIVEKKDMVIEEYRVHGRIYKVKVTPKIGLPYYMIDERGDGVFLRRDGPDAANMAPPRWVIFSF